MEKISLQELIDAITKATGISKKEADDLLHVFPEIIEEGLKKDGVVKVKGLGTFKLKRVAARAGRNMQTGERVTIPAHNKVTFTPEKDMAEHVNKDFKYLTYKELGEKEASKEKPEKKPPAPPVQKQEAPPPTPVKKEEKPTPKAPPPPPEKPKQPAKKGSFNPYWYIPIVLFIIAVLLVIFYLRACQDEEPPAFKPVPSEQPVLKQAEPAEDTAALKEEEVQEPVEEVVEEPVEEISKVQEPFNYTIERGEYLYQLGGKFYGDSLLWVLIYRENKEILDDPEEVATGKTLVIPALEGSAGNLTRNDSVRISDGYRILYEYYGALEDARTSRFYWGMIRYRP